MAGSPQLCSTPEHWRVKSKSTTPHALLSLAGRLIVERVLPLGKAVEASRGTSITNKENVFTNSCQPFLQLFYEGRKNP